MAPEVLMQQRYNKSVDVFSFGLVLLDIWSASAHRCSALNVVVHYLMVRCIYWCTI